MRNRKRRRGSSRFHEPRSAIVPFAGSGGVAPPERQSNLFQRGGLDNDPRIFTMLGMNLFGKRVFCYSDSGRNRIPRTNRHWMLPHLMRLFFILFLLLALVCPASASSYQLAPPVDNGQREAELARKREEIAEAQAYEKRVVAAEGQKEAVLQTGPYRIVEGLTNDVRSSAGWVHFFGRVSRTLTNGIVMSGYMLPLASEDRNMVLYFMEGASSAFYIPDPSLLSGAAARYGTSPSPVYRRTLYMPHLPMPEQFFVANFPHAVLDSQELLARQYYMAKYIGIGEVGYSQMKKCDYGKISRDPPPEKAKAADDKKRAANANTLKHWRERALEGAALYQFFLGNYYFTNSFEQDLALACEWLAKAAAQGHEQAEVQLKKVRLASSASASSETNSSPQAASETNSPPKAESRTDSLPKAESQTNSPPKAGSS
jgi:hypothetical protein